MRQDFIDKYMEMEYLVKSVMKAVICVLVLSKISRGLLQLRKIIDIFRHLSAADTLSCTQYSSNSHIVLLAS